MQFELVNIPSIQKELEHRKTLQLRLQRLFQRRLNKIVVEVTDVGLDFVVTLWLNADGKVYQAEQNISPYSHHSYLDFEQILKDLLMDLMGQMFLIDRSNELYNP